MKRLLYVCLLILAMAALTLPWIIRAARADGLPSSAAAQASRPLGFACYLGAYGSGAFTRARTDIASFASMDQGDATLGAGPEVGCDLIGGQFVLGVLADYTFQSGSLNTTMGGLQMSAKLPDEWFVGGRLGVYTNGYRHTLLYALGGVAGRSRTSLNLVGTGLSIPFGGDTSGVIGAGIETVLLTDWDLFLEYRHEFETSRNGMLLSTIPTATAIDSDILHGGIRYRFGS